MQSNNIIYWNIHVVRAHINDGNHIKLYHIGNVSSMWWWNMYINKMSITWNIWWFHFHIFCSWNVDQNDRYGCPWNQRSLPIRNLESIGCIHSHCWVNFYTIPHFLKLETFLNPSFFKLWYCSLFYLLKIMTLSLIFRFFILLQMMKQSLHEKNLNSLFGVKKIQFW